MGRTIKHTDRETGHIDTEYRDIGNGIGSE